MKSKARLDLFATLLGAVAGAVTCALWAFLAWHRPSFLAAILGGITGAVGGFLRSTTVEALVVGGLGSFGLWFLHRLSEGHEIARVVFSLLAGIIVGKLAGALTTLSSHDNAA